MDVREAEIAPGISVGEMFMIKPEQVEDGCVQVVHVNLLLDGLEAQLVGGPVDVAALDSAPGHPHREPVMVVVATVHLPLVRAGSRQLDCRRAAELAPPDDQGIIEHAALFEVGQEGGDRPVALVRQLAMTGRQVVVMIPRLAVSVPELNEADAAFQEAPGGQELPRLNARPVHLADRSRLLADVKGIAGFRLHAVRQLERLNARFELGFSLALIEVPPVELGKQIKLGALSARADTTVLDVRDQFLDFFMLAIDVCSLIDPRQKGRLPVLRLGNRKPARAHHNEPGEILVLGSQPVEDPGADARPSLALRRNSSA